MKSRGFTLIELLVVIAIIGILSSVVLASLNSARNKGSDSAIKANLANARAQAELYYDTQSNVYTGVCANTSSGIANNVVAASKAAGDTVTAGQRCADDSDEWVAISNLKGGGVYCVDYKGYAGTTSKAVLLNTGKAADVSAATFNDTTATRSCL